jgi:methylamine dehydrogenase heavy chain
MLLIVYGAFAMRLASGLARLYRVRMWFTRSLRWGTAVAVAGAALASAAHAQLPSDIGSGPETAVLPPPSKHWVWVNDFVFPHMADGMAYLVDGDSGGYLGTLSTGYGFAHVLLSRDGKVIYSPETYFSRGTRGTRTDVVTVYDAKTLKVLREVAIPPKRSSNLPMIADAALTDDDRFLMIYNFNPAQSITVVDTKSDQFAGEVQSAGCALVYPTGPRSFFSLCGDGALLMGVLDEKGRARTHRTAPLFAVAGDPVTEKPVRVGNTWYFVSFGGVIYPVTVTAQEAVVGKTWRLTSEAERQAGWRPGGLQQLTVDGSRGRLYALMHQGDLSTHKDPGKDVWVFDIATGQPTQRISLKNPASSILLTSDALPLLFSIAGDSSILDVYDGTSGRLLRSVDHIGTTPTVMVSP